MESKRILEFLAECGEKVQENEPSWMVELVMDNHKVVEFEGQQYYICEDTPLTGDEEEIYDYLIENHLF